MIEFITKEDISRRIKANTLVINKNASMENIDDIINEFIAKHENIYLKIALSAPLQVVLAAVKRDFIDTISFDKGIDTQFISKVAAKLPKDAILILGNHLSLNNIILICVALATPEREVMLEAPLCESVSVVAGVWRHLEIRNRINLANIPPPVFESAKLLTQVGETMTNKMQIYLRNILDLKKQNAKQQPLGQVVPGPTPVTDNKSKKSTPKENKSSQAPAREITGMESMQLALAQVSNNPIDTGILENFKKIQAVIKDFKETGSVKYKQAVKDLIQLTSWYLDLDSPGKSKAVSDEINLQSQDYKINKDLPAKEKLLQLSERIRKHHKADFKQVRSEFLEEEKRRESTKLKFGQEQQEKVCQSPSSDNTSQNLLTH